MENRHVLSTTSRTSTTRYRSIEVQESDDPRDGIAQAPYPSGASIGPSSYQQQTAVSSRFSSSYPGTSHPTAHTHPPFIPPQAPQLAYQQLPPQPADQQPPADPQWSLMCMKVTRLFNLVFYFFCLLTGQYITKLKPPLSLKSLLLLFVALVGMVVFVAQFFANVGSLLFNCYVVMFCPFPNCTYFYSSIDNITSSNSRGNGSGVFGAAADSRPKFANWNNAAVITAATFSGWISYLVMTFLVVIPIYSNMYTCFDFTRSPQNQIDSKKVTCVCDMILKIFCTTLRKTFKHGVALSPFDDRQNEDTSTSLSPIQAIYFHLFYMVNLSFYFTNLGLLSLIMHDRISGKNHYQYYLDYSGLVFQMSSQFCAVQSCFIFSKVAYTISNQCDQLISEFDKVDRDIAEILQENNDLHTYLENAQGEGVRPLLQSPFKELSNKGRYYLLQNIDQAFILRAGASLDPYGLWFSIHWVLYTLTTLLSGALFAQTFIKIFLSGHSPLFGLSYREVVDLAYVFFFTIEHTALFLYPCFRAASVTAARERMIQKVSSRRWRFIPMSISGQFVQYLKAQNFGFKMSIFCADLPFGFNMAYISLFLGVFGVILKVSV